MQSILVPAWSEDLSQLRTKNMLKYSDVVQNFESPNKNGSFNNKSVVGISDSTANPELFQQISTSSSSAFSKIELELSLKELLLFPCLIILIGLPGCGKSTFTTQLCQESQLHGVRWHSVNQDVYKSRHKTYQAAEDILSSSNCNLIVDRCNFNDSQRRTWTQLARKHNMKIISIALPHYDDITFCAERAIMRGVDDLHDQGINWLDVCGKMRSEMTLPTAEEDIDLRICCDDGADADVIRILSGGADCDEQKESHTAGGS